MHFVIPVNLHQVNGISADNKKIRTLWKYLQMNVNKP